MSLVQGRNVVLKIFDVDGYYPIACNSSCSLDMSVDEIETTFLGAGAMKTYLPGKISSTLSGNGPIYFDRDVTAKDVYDYTKARQIVLWNFELVDNSNNYVNFSGQGFFTSFKIVGDVAGPATCDYTIRVTGAVNSNVATAPPSSTGINTLIYDAVGGENSFQDNRLLSKTIIDVERNGIGLIVITSGTPQSNEVFYNTNGTLTFGYSLGANEWVQVIYYA